MAKPFQSRRVLGHAVPGHAVPGHAVPGHAVPGHAQTVQPRRRPLATIPLKAVPIAAFLVPLLVPVFAILFASVASPADAEARPANSDPADAPPANSDPANSDPANGTDRQTSPGRPVIGQAEAKVLQMVREHLPELRPMLQRLRADAPDQYRRAIVDLARSARRLESARRRDQMLYEIEVETLQAKTDVNLAAARLKVRDRQADRNALRQSIIRVHQAEQRRAEYEVELLQQRRKRVESQLGEAQERLKAKRSDMQSAVDANFEMLLRRAGRGTKD